MLRDRKAKAGVIGLGYVGLPLSMVLCEAGFDVTGFDISEQKVKLLLRVDQEGNVETEDFVASE